MSLARLARREADIVVLSIFVNPLQFGPNEDFKRYPRDMRRDSLLCRRNGVDVVFYPSVSGMYPCEQSVAVDENRVSAFLCGRMRPGHFRGVLTVVAKLFNIVQPDVAVFGQKDAQQAALIGRMVCELNFPVKMIVGPIVREKDGLAMSSRNAYLNQVERRDALCLSAALRAARSLYRAGERGSTAIKRAMLNVIAPVRTAAVDYIEIVDRETFAPLDRIGRRGALVALAVKIGKTRLIDNLPLPDDRLGNLPDG